MCTSYDEAGRFHAQDAKRNWFQNIDNLHAQGVRLVCTCIQTQDFFEAEYALPEWLDVNLCDPHLGVEWYIAVDKATTTTILLPKTIYSTFRKDPLQSSGCATTRT